MPAFERASGRKYRNTLAGPPLKAGVTGEENLKPKPRIFALTRYCPHSIVAGI
jgi:hypothetical protein